MNRLDDFRRVAGGVGEAEAAEKGARKDAEGATGLRKRVTTLSSAAPTSDKSATEQSTTITSASDLLASGEAQLEAGRSALAARMGAALFRALQSLRAALEGCARDLGTHDGRLRGTGALLVGPERFERQDTLTVVSDTKASLVQLEQALADLRRQLDQQVTSLPNDWYQHLGTAHAHLVDRCAALARWCQDIQNHRRRVQAVLDGVRLATPTLLPRPLDSSSTRPTLHLRLKKANTDTAKPELTNKSLKASGVHPRDGPMATNVGREDPTPASSSDGASDMTPSPAMSQALAQQVRQFRTELHDMAREVDQAQDTLYELASMQSRLMGKLQEQDVTIEQIQQDAETTLHNVDRGNEELTEAIRYNRDFRQGVLLFFIILSLCLLFFDYLSG